MRKLLLIAAALFSLGSMAQRPLDFTKNIRTFNKNLKLNSLMSQMPTSHIAKPAKAQAKAPAKAPEGESRTYYLDFYNQCYGVGIFPEVHKAVNIIFGSENKVYIQNMMYPSQFNTYIEGELNGNVITIKNGQLIGEIQGYNMVLCNMVLDETTGQISLDTSKDFTLTIDENYGIITSDITKFIGIFTEDYEMVYTCSGMMQFTPAELYPEADKHEYTYDYEAYSTPLQTNKKGTVQIINLGQYSYVKGLMPEEAPDAWLMAVNENGSLSITLPQIIEEDRCAAFVDFKDGGSIIQTPVTFEYDKASDSYVLSEYSLTNLFASYDEASGTLGIGYSASYDNLKIKAYTTGINKVEDSDADVVSTEYYDLSGRSLNNAQKGINIKVMKYSDGTTKTVKVAK